MLIYDVGMHNGDDTDYYLSKGARVVAIEADAELCAAAAARFSGPTGEGRLTILNLAVSGRDGEADFFIRDHETVLSSLQPGGKGPQPRVVRVTLRRLSGIFAEHGTPDFAKIDIEGSDHLVLRDLREARALPAHLSVEAHTFDVVLECLRAGHSRFRLVNGKTVSRRFGSARIKTTAGSAAFAFRHHSSGPFGDDLPDPWLNAEQFVIHWLHRGTLLGPGWYDAHLLQ
ncbi:FkbM family methyltransferase [Falsiroseomonas sp. HW251]|uniref:FkbM family methyltransferase n=1 Tax=Falsiroseomonas sp. HW251 TaxID=3390998 RepID=UPI003D313A3C